MEEEEGERQPLVPEAVAAAVVRVRLMEVEVPDATPMAWAEVEGEEEERAPTLQRLGPEAVEGQQPELQRVELWEAVAGVMQD